MIVKLVSKNFDIPNAHTLSVAREHGRYDSLKKLFSMSPEEVTCEVEQSGLRGKGGGGAVTNPSILPSMRMRENLAPLKTVKF